MRVGEDYDKIEFQFLGLDLLEPNAFIGDFLIFIVAIYLAHRTKKLNNLLPFFRRWKSFYVVFGIGFLIGGFGHLLYNYWGTAGKISPWYFGIVASFFIEKAMVSIHDNIALRLLLNRLIVIKLILSIAALTLIILTVDLSIDPTIGMLVPTLNSLIGLLFVLGYLGVYYSNKITNQFKFLWISLLIMIPSVFFLSLKISFNQWFDRNDISHLLLITGMIFYFLSIRGYANHLKKASTINR